MGHPAVLLSSVMSTGLAGAILQRLEITGRLDCGQLLLFHRLDRFFRAILDRCI